MERQSAAERFFLFDAPGGEGGQTQPALGFDTGLDARSFAQAKTARYLTEPGLIVRPDGSIEEWKAAGVLEMDKGGRQTMVVWGPAFIGSRLDVLLEDSEQRDEALQAIAHWLRAQMLLSAAQDIALTAPLCPYAAIVAGAGGNYPPGTCFFAPENLARRCFQVNGEEARITCGEWYVHPGVGSETPAAGFVPPEALSFGAAAMLYRLFANAPPFSALDETCLHEDIRAGNFLPLRLAAPGIDLRLASLVDAALCLAKNRLPSAASGTAQAETPSPEKILATIQPEGNPAPGIDSFFSPLPAGSRAALEKEKKRFLKRQAAAVNSKRFIARNAAIIVGCFAALAAAVLIVFSVHNSRASLPTTAGLEPAEVIERYYNAIGTLDHQLMETCVTRGAGKNDINMVASYFVVNRVRQAYEFNAAPLLLSAADWLERGGGPVEAQVFGVTDLRLERLAGGGDSAETRYRADYRLWLPAAETAGVEPPGEADAPAAKMPQELRHSDEINLVRKKGNWLISAIQREAL